MMKILIAALILFGSQAAHADVLEINRAGPSCDARFQACTLVVQITGVITDITTKQLQAIVEETRREAEQNHYSFAFLQAELDSLGGDVDAAMAIGRLLRKENAAAIVNRDAVCLSACVLVLAGGASRGLEGTIGIHRPYFPVPTEQVSAANVRASYQEMLGRLRAYLREMNVDEGLADAMLRIDPEHMHVLSGNELNQYGLSKVDAVTAETFDLEQAQLYGLDRSEYMRRKLLAEQQCGGSTSIATGCYRSILKNGYFEQPDFSQYGRAR